MRQAYLRRIRHWIANRGLRGFLAESLYRAKLILKRQPIPGRPNTNPDQHPFDRAHHVDTAGLVWSEALETPPTDTAQYWATGYYGIAPSAFTAALASLNLPWPSYTFVDIGCGKGRALLLATRFPFRRLLGIELSPTLAATAQRNLATFSAPWRQPNLPAEVISADATTTPLPSGPLLLFLYHPFAAPVMKRFLAHLTTTTAEALLLYANPELAPLLDAIPGLHQLWRQTFPLSEEDGAADRFGSYGETFALYQLKTPALKTQN